MIKVEVVEKRGSFFIKVSAWGKSITDPRQFGSRKVAEDHAASYSMKKPKKVKRGV